MPEPLSCGFFAIVVLIAESGWVVVGDSSSSTRESSFATGSAGESSSANESIETGSSGIGKAGFVDEANAIWVKGERAQEAECDGYVRAHHCDLLERIEELEARRR